MWRTGWSSISSTTTGGVWEPRRCSLHQFGLNNWNITIGSDPVGGSDPNPKFPRTRCTRLTLPHLGAWSISCRRLQSLDRGQQPQPVRPPGGAESRRVRAANTTSGQRGAPSGGSTSGLTVSFKGLNFERSNWNGLTADFIWFYFIFRYFQTLVNTGIVFSAPVRRENTLGWKHWFNWGFRNLKRNTIFTKKQFSSFYWVCFLEYY